MKALEKFPFLEVSLRETDGRSLEVGELRPPMTLPKGDRVPP